MNMVVTGKVIPGDQIGRTIGFPTANLDTKLTPQQLRPGVYLAQVNYQGTVMAGVAYFGPRHITGQLKDSFEVFIIDFDQDIYDQKLEVTLIKFIRSPLKLDTIDQLTTQLQQDISVVTKLLKKAPNHGTVTV